MPAWDRDKDRGVFIGIVLLIAILVGTAAFSYHYLQQLNAEAGRVEHTNQVLATLDGTLSSVTEAATAQRGYLITGNEEHVTQFEEAVQDSEGHVDVLASLVADNPEQVARLPDLRRKLAARIDLLRQRIEVRRNQGFEAAQVLVTTWRGDAEMAALHDTILEFQVAERELLAERSGRESRAFEKTVVSDLLGTLAGLLGVGLLAWLLKRYSDTRRAAATQLWAEAERFRTTLASIGDAVLTTDTMARVQFLNPIAESLTGWTKDEARGQPLQEVLKIINEKSRRSAENPVDRVLQEGVIVGLANHTLLIRKDGVEIPIDDSAAPIRDESGAMTGCVLVFRDITARKQSEAEIARLLASEKRRAEQLRKLTEAAVTLNSATTRDSVVRVVQTEAKLLLNVEKAEVLLEDEPPDSDETVSTSLVGRGGRPIGYLSLDASPPHEITPDDEAILVQLAQLAAIAVQNAELYEELRLADERKNEFLATLAHELRNPLAPIRHAVELMKLSHDDLAAFEESRNIIDRQVVQMVRLIDDLLDISRISRGKIELRKEPVKLQDVLAAAVEASGPLMDNSQHQFTVEIPDEDVVVDADPARLSQVVMNLLDNAAKYTSPGGHVGLVVENGEQEILIRVRDDGAGIPTEMLDQIFEMFSQVDRSLERTRGGLGIGLTLVRRLVELHGGTIEAHSSGEGQGSEFVVRLPRMSRILRPAERDGESSPDTSSLQTKKRRLRVLAVDDNQDAVNTLAKLLEFNGHEVQMAYDGQQALDIAARFRPSVVLLDIGLPRLSGYDVARRLRQMPEGKSIFLVAVTGWGQDDDRRRSQEAGFDFHLVKPVDPAELEQILSDIASRK